MHHRTASVNTGMVSLIFPSCFFEKKKGPSSPCGRGDAHTYIYHLPFGYQDLTKDHPTAMILSCLLDRWPLAESPWYAHSSRGSQKSLFLMRIPSVLCGLRASAEQLLGTSSLGVIHTHIILPTSFSHLPLFSLRRTFTRRSSISHPVSCFL